MLQPPNLFRFVRSSTFVIALHGSGFPSRPSLAK